MATAGVHHLYVETHSWQESLQFWEAHGFKLDEGWGAGGDGILRPPAGPYVFLREVPEDKQLTFDVCLAADDLEVLAANNSAGAVGAPYEAEWGPRLLHVSDPDGRSLTVREHERA
jgi:catechol 2,3-dioxygenase-like lactoylglutathione lyase family enzyme